VAGAKGGEFKVEIVNNSGRAHALCLVRDTAGHVGRITSRGSSLADGTSHKITCTKTSTSVTVAVDGLTPRTGVASGGLGSVSNTADLFIGAKNKAYEDRFADSISAATLF
jgi:Laminin G domain